MKAFSICLLSAPFLLLAACGEQGEAPPAVDKEAVLGAIKAVQDGQAAAFAADDAETATAVYTADATFAASGMPVMHGITAIRSEFDSLIADPATALTITPAGGWVADSGDLATTTSDYTFTFTGPDGKPTTETGLNQTLWHKEGDSWKIVVDTNTPVVPADQAEPDPADPEAA